MKCFISCIMTLAMLFCPVGAMIAQVPAPVPVPNPVPGPLPVPVPPTDEEIWIAINESVSQDLFGLPVDLTNYRYEFQEEIETTGTYAGSTFIGDTFDFQVLLHAPVAITGLTAAEAQEVADRELISSEVIGVLSSSFGSAAVQGNCISQINPVNGLLESGLIINHQFDLDDPIILGLSIGSGPGGGAQAVSGPTSGPAPAPAPMVIPRQPDFSGYPRAPRGDQDQAFRQIHRAVFGNDAAAGEYTFQTSTAVHGTGVYSGANANAESFTANVATYNEVDPAELGFTRGEARHLDDQGNVFALISGDIDGEPFAGIASSGDGMGHISIVEHGPAQIRLGLGEIIWIPLKLEVVDQQCQSDCAADHAAALAANEAAHAATQACADSDESTANNVHTAEIIAITGVAAAASAAVGAAFVAATSACASTYAATVVTCILLLASFWATLAGIACMAAAAVVVAACEAAAIAVLGAAEAGILAAYNSSKAAADADLAAAQAAAAAKRAGADSTKAAADQAAMDALTSCLEGCVMCITIWIPIPIFFF